MWLLIKWGPQRREKHLGYAADYCPICRKVESFDLLEERVAIHLWYIIPLQRGTLLGYKKICRGCQTMSDGYPNAYREIGRSGSEPLDTLIAKTNPLVREIHKEKLALAERLAAGGDGVDEATRHRLMMEAFSFAEPHFHHGYGHQGRRILTVSLRPLRPTEEEIRACLRRYRESGSRMGARLRTAEVMQSIYPESEMKDPDKFSY
jgi:hypothetical protein